jgi:acylphosphatase
LEGSQARLLATIHGGVQGVGFRDCIWRQARRLRLTGYVRNLPGGVSVEMQAGRLQPALQELVSLLRTGPTSARVTSV